jgi:hypothetical protein
MDYIEKQINFSYKQLIIISYFQFKIMFKKLKKQFQMGMTIFNSKNNKMNKNIKKLTLMFVKT